MAPALEEIGLIFNKNIMDNPNIPSPGVNPYESVGTSPVPYYLVLAVTIIVVSYIYGLNFNKYSETEMVRLSYYFIPGFAFSITGLITKKSEKSLLYSIVSAIVSTGLLIVFFELFWELL